MDNSAIIATLISCYLAGYFIGFKFMAFKRLLERAS